MNMQASPAQHFDLSTRIRSTLARGTHFLGRTLDIEMHGDDVVLTGVVDTYYQKQLAQESIRDIDGIGRIHNEIEVQSLPERESSTSSLRLDGYLQ